MGIPRNRDDIRWRYQLAGQKAGELLVYFALAWAVCVVLGIALWIGIFLILFADYCLRYARERLEKLDFANNEVEIAEALIRVNRRLAELAKITSKSEDPKKEAYELFREILRCELAEEEKGEELGTDESGPAPVVCGLPEERY